jgi:heme oxygenase (mycobilin-producing)
MFVTMNHIQAQGEAGPALEARFSARQRLVDTMPGFRSFELLRPVDVASHAAREGSEYLVATAWDSRDAFQAWATNPQQRQVHPAQRGPLAGADSTAWATMHESVDEAYAGDWATSAVSAPAPIVTMNVMDVAAGFEQAFEDVFRNRAGEVELQPGFLSLEVLRQVMGDWNGPGEAPDGVTAYQVSTRWLSQQAYEAWTTSEAFKLAHSQRRMPEGAILRGGLRVFEIRLPSYGGTPAAVPH